MAILGWILFSLLALFGIFILVLFVIPFVVTETKMMNEKIKRAIEDKKYDLEKKSEARRNRDAIKREKENQLKDKKLEAKMVKVEKQIEIQQKRLDLAKELKDQAEAEKADLIKTRQQINDIKKEDKKQKKQIVEEAVESEILEPEE